MCTVTPNQSVSFSQEASGLGSGSPNYQSCGVHVWSGQKAAFSTLEVSC